MYETLWLLVPCCAIFYSRVQIIQCWWEGRNLQWTGFPIKVPIIWLAPWVGKMNWILHCDWLREQAIWCFIIWLAPWVGKMNWILPWDWLPEQAIWCFIIWLALWVGKMNRILNCTWLTEQARWCYLAWSMALSTQKLSINTQKKKNLANIQPCWPHAWSITHILPNQDYPLFLEREWHSI